MKEDWDMTSSGTIGFEVRVAPLSPHAILPHKAHATDAGFDLALPADQSLDPHEQLMIDLELVLEIPPGWYGQVLGRSSVFQRGISVHPGVIDADYRGSLRLLLRNERPVPQHLQRGDRLAQLMFLPVPKVTLTSVAAETLSETARGHGGIGSTGR
jgi:dUTP pyrophosphatase